MEARARARARLEALWARGRALLGTETAIMGGAMTWVSERSLVSALSNAGGFGVLACGAMTPERLAEEIRATRALTDRPFGVNLILMHPALAELIAVCGAEGVTHVVLAGGVPGASTLGDVKGTGARVLSFAPSAIVARKLVRAGVDGLIIEGMEAGGHIGPVSTLVLAQEILPDIHEVPVFVAGGIGRGEAIVSFLEMGASGVQLGTRFVCATESVAHPRFKQAFIRAHARDAQATVQLDPRLPVIPVRALVNEATRAFMEFQRATISRHEAGGIDLDAARLGVEHWWAGSLRRAVVEGDVEHGSLMAGQSVGQVTAEQPIGDILGELVGQALGQLETRLAAEAAA